MRALFGHGEHPDSEAIIAAYLTANVRAGMTDRQLETARDAAIAAARLGNPFPAYKPLEKFDARVAGAAFRDQGGDRPRAVRGRGQEGEGRRGAPIAGRRRRVRPRLLPGQVRRAAVGDRRAGMGPRRDPQRARGGAARGAGPGRGARGVHQDRARRDRAGRDERADRGGVRALGLTRRGPEPAHPRRRLVEGPGDGREVAVTGRADAVPDDGRGVGGLQHGIRGRAVGVARRHLHRPAGHCRGARAGAGDHRRAGADDRVLLPAAGGDRGPVRRAGARLPERARARPGRGRVPPAGPAGQPRHPAGQEAAPLAGRQAGRVAGGADRAVRRGRGRLADAGGPLVAGG